ncbi:hypothetical protein FQR65_LT07003 [Abscondita terminalis]|nr:hypothetical protein FQR65_LT07003 [Abscondita terminalis]
MPPSKYLPVLPQSTCSLCLQRFLKRVCLAASLLYHFDTLRLNIIMDTKQILNLNDPKDIEYLRKFVLEKDEDEIHPNQVEDFEDEPDTDAEDEPAEERIDDSDTEESGAEGEPSLENNLCYLAIIQYGIKETKIGKLYK